MSLRHDNDSSPPAESSQAPRPDASFGALATQRTTLGFAARLLKHVGEFEQSQARVQKATAALREESTPGTRAEARDALAAHVKAARRLARSRMRMQEAIEAETGEREPWFEEQT